MSNTVVFKENLPAHLQNVQLDDFTKAFAASGGAVKRISLRGRVFRLVDGGKEIAKNPEPHLDVVIVNGSRTVQKAYYGSEYDPDATSAPDCWSSNGENPDPEVAEPQHTRCKECPKAIKGSGGSGRAACKFSMRLAIVLRNNVGGDIFQLVLPQKSIFGTGDLEHMPFLQYARYVGQSGYNLNMLCTRMSFDLDSDVPKLFFSNVEFLDLETHTAAKQQGASSIAVNAAKLNFTKKNNEAKMPPMIAPPGSAAAQLKGGDEAVPEPVKRPATSKKAEAPAPKQSVKSMLDKWGDDQ